MRAKCVECSDHNVFYTTAHVVEEWKVDRAGNFLEQVGTGEVVHGPDPGNRWECGICGSKAVVE